MAATAIAALDCGAASRPAPDVSLTPGGRAVDGRFVPRVERRGDRTVLRYGDEPAGSPDLDYLRFRFGRWHVAVYDFRSSFDGGAASMTGAERAAWKSSFSGHEDAGGYLRLQGTGPLRLARAGEHAGPQLAFGSLDARWLAVRDVRLASGPVPALPARSRLARRRRALGGGPRGDWQFAAQRSRSGRRIQVNFFGSGRARSKLLVAGCANGRRCAGEQVVRALAYDCPPSDAEFWLMPTLRPEGADLDAHDEEPGAAALRQSVADLRPTLTVVYRNGPRAMVRADGAGLAAARTYSRLAGIPVGPPLRDGLAAWTQRALPRAAAITIVLPSARLAHLEAHRHAYALQRIAGTRFARPVTSRSSADGRLSALLPEGWYAAQRALTAVDGEALALATFPLRHPQPRPGCLVASVRRRIGPDDALILVFDHGAAASGVPARPRHFRLDRRARAMSGCFGEYAIRFAEGGRDLEIRVALGDERNAYRRGDAQDVLDSLQVKP